MLGAVGVVGRLKRKGACVCGCSHGAIAGGMVRRCSQWRLHRRAAMPAASGATAVAEWWLDCRCRRVQGGEEADRRQLRSEQPMLLVLLMMLKGVMRVSESTSCAERTELEAHRAAKPTDCTLRCVRAYESSIRERPLERTSDDDAMSNPNRGGSSSASRLTKLRSGQSV
mmetsp:Transcript_35779/g.89097  ORF Transcript_35779/g.89097 Transcript_35779/m.89097 type:complete len:170 (+) Transcript_35779:275-784(+)